MMDSWWNRATTEQRLAQIAGGIECGLTAAQIGILSGIDPDRRPGAIVRVFANCRGIRLHDPVKLKAIRVRAAAPGKLRRAFLRGEPVDFFAGSASDRDEFALDEVEV